MGQKKLQTYCFLTNCAIMCANKACLVRLWVWQT